MSRRQQPAAMDQTSQYANSERTSAESDQINHAARPRWSVLISVSHRFVQLFDVASQPETNRETEPLGNPSNDGKVYRRIEHDKGASFFAALVLVRRDGIDLLRVGADPLVVEDDLLVHAAQIEELDEACDVRHLRAPRIAGAV